MVADCLVVAALVDCLPDVCGVAICGLAGCSAVAVAVCGVAGCSWLEVLTRTSFLTVVRRAFMSVMTTRYGVDVLSMA